MKQMSEPKSVRKLISSSFVQLQCCLMPYPGKDVASARNYDGQWKLMEEEFKKELVNTIEKNLQVFISKYKSMTKFIDERKMGNAEHWKKYRTLLGEQIEKLGEQWQNQAFISIQKLKGAKIVKSRDEQTKKTFWSKKRFLIKLKR